MDMSKFNRMLRFERSGGKALQELDSLTGLKEFKETMNLIVKGQKRQVVSMMRQKPLREISNNMCFLGNPGTGKTAMSRRAASLLYQCGAISRGELLIAGRGDLVGEHVGETALKTKALLQKAKGAVLLIDEAYALVDDRDGSFGDEAISTLVEYMDREREQLTIIFAGYPEKMERFLEINPGLRSRIPHMIHLPDYSEEELYSIAEKFAQEDGYWFAEDVKEKMVEHLCAAKQAPEFGNARYVRNLVDRAELEKARKIDLSKLMELPDEEVFRLEAADFIPLQAAAKYTRQKRIGF